jgi:hypothetical protein
MPQNKACMNYGVWLFSFLFSLELFVSLRIAVGEAAHLGERLAPLKIRDTAHLEIKFSH